MTKVLAYCAFLRHPPISLPQSGISGAPLHEMVHGELDLLWSRVEWPFVDSSLQRSAIEFHQVISQVFSRAAAIPFRLLSLFEDYRGLCDFVIAHQAGFIADLRRLQNVVQMECVLYPTPAPGATTSGRDYLQKRAAVLRRAQDFVQSFTAALGPLNQGMRVRDSNKGSRIFTLVERGNELKFHSLVREIPIPEGLSRRTSGPWPPSEFLSDAVKMPQITR